MAVLTYDVIHHYKVDAVLTQPLHIGSAGGNREEILIHPVTRAPFIQASGIAGSFRSFFETKCGPDDGAVTELFGSAGNDPNDHPSRIRFSDGVFSGDLKVERRPHVKLDPASGTVASEGASGAGTRFDTEYIGAGAKFTFEIEVYSLEDHAAQDLEDVETILAALHGEQIQLGAHKSTGSGYLNVEKAVRHSFLMTDGEERRKWMHPEETPLPEYEDLELKDAVPAGTAYYLTLRGRTQGDLLIRAIAVAGVGEEAPDSSGIQNAKGDYIIPGSSLKGVVRNRAEVIAAYLEKTGKTGARAEQLILDAFGGRRKDADKKDRDTGRRGNLYFMDTVVGDREANEKAPLQHRIHIDKLTGGVMYGGKFSQKNVFGEMTIRIRVMDENIPDRSCGLLLMVLRDLMAGLYNLGSGYSIGKGFLEIDSIEILDAEGHKAVLTREGIRDDSSLIDRCMKALTG
ncbi:MAG: RAMP superfamily CRISPR-associated protein [Eubacteriales bacterium]|nr:RAMP superfamily CRISPR-associated protein [Eubacteriales bacterium]